LKANLIVVISFALALGIVVGIAIGIWADMNIIKAVRVSAVAAYSRFFIRVCYTLTLNR